MKNIADLERLFVQERLEARWLHQHIPLRWISGIPYTGEVKVVRALEQDAVVMSEHGVTWHLPIRELERLEALGHQKSLPSWRQRLIAYVRSWRQC